VWCFGAVARTRRQEQERDDRTHERDAGGHQHARVHAVDERVLCDFTPDGTGLPSRNSATLVEYTDDSTEPMTATPIAPPTCRVVSLTAEPTPALPSGSELMIDSVAGAMVSAMPVAMRHMRITTSGQYDEWAVRLTMEPRPTVTSSSPVPTTNLVPTFDTKRALSGANVIMHAAIGRKRRPVSHAEYPSTNWKYCVMRNVEPNIAKNTSMMPVLAALNRGFLKKVTSSIG
jgi:hypothetical protein